MEGTADGTGHIFLQTACKNGGLSVKKEAICSEILFSFFIVVTAQCDKLLMLCGHSDVVPVGDSWIYTQPFEPIIKGDTLIGRGVSDNKSGEMLAEIERFYTEEIFGS